jgi:hypothetical protein
MSTTAADAALRRRVALGTVGLGVAAAALSVVVLASPGLLTPTSRRAVGATAAAFGTTPTVAFVAVHAPLLFGVLAGAVGAAYVGLLLPGGVGASASGDAGTPGGAASAGVPDRESLAAALRVHARAGAAATGVALGAPLAAAAVGPPLAAAGGPLPPALAAAFVAGLPLGVLALCGATVGTALAARTGLGSAALLGTVGPVAGLLVAHAAPTGPVWAATAGATALALGAVVGGWWRVDGG